MPDKNLPKAIVVRIVKEGAHWGAGADGKNVTIK